MLGRPVDERRRLVEQRRRHRVAAQVDRRVVEAAATRRTISSALRGPQHAELGRREVPRLALVDRALAVVAEGRRADEGQVREALVQDAAGRGRPAAPVGDRPPVAGERARPARRRRARRAGRGSTRSPTPSTGRSGDRSPSRTRASRWRCRRRAGRRPSRSCRSVAQRAIHAAVSSTPRLHPASTMRPSGSTATRPRLVGRDARSALAPRQVDPEDAHAQSRA